MRLPFGLLSVLVVTAIHAMPVLLLLTLVSFVPELRSEVIPSISLRLLVMLAVAPLGYATLFMLVAAAISRPYQRAIVPGKFPRDLSHPVYRARRIYGLCWTSVYYHKPVYYLMLTIPALRKLMFRAFGYRGQLDFTVYPDTWIRDLPLLDLGAAAYLANRATLGTNMALSNGTCFVDRIRVGAGATVGHLAVLAPGATIGDRAEVGATTVVGIGVRVGERANLQPCAGINHAARIGDGATVGSAAYVGAAAIVLAGAHVPPAGNVPNRTRFGDEVQPVQAESAPAAANAAS